MRLTTVDKSRCFDFIKLNVRRRVFGRTGPSVENVVIRGSDFMVRACHEPSAVPKVHRE